MAKKSWFIIFQHLTPQHLLTRIVGWLAECRIVWVKNTFIKAFIKRFKVDLREAIITDFNAFPNFNHFFTRLLQPHARPISGQSHEIISPVDGCVSQIGDIEKGRIIQAKGFDFSVEELLNESSEACAALELKKFTTLYLAPSDYHRIHMPCEGTLVKTRYIPGKLFSVNHHTAASVPRVFARNERLACWFKTQHGNMVMVLVGAMIVGSITTVWQDKYKPRKLEAIRYPEQGPGSVHLAQGSEMGLFKLGSTVILLLPSQIQWLTSYQTLSVVRMGQTLATSYNSF